MSPIYVSEPRVSTSYADVLEDVCLRLDNDLEPKSASFAGDGVAEILHLPDKSVCAGANAPIVYTVSSDVPAVTTVLTDGTDYTVDYQAGYVTLLTDHVDEGLTLWVDYKIRHWGETLLARIINNGLQSLFPKFYCIVELTPAADANGEYLLEDALDRVVEAIIDVEDVDSSGTYHLSPARDYRIVRTTANAAKLRLFSTLNGTLTVHAAVRPVSFTYDETTLADLGLPERMREPLVLYTCWQAIVQKMPARSRWDNTTALNTEGKTTFFDHARMVAVFKALLDTELSTNYMRPWTSRGL